MELVSAAAAVDPTTGVLGSVYISLDDEMIALGPILEMGPAVGPNAEMVGPFSDAFLVDRATVWEKLFEILLTSNSITVIKTAKASRNGRLAYKLLYAHYLAQTTSTTWQERLKRSLPAAPITVRSATGLLRSMLFCTIYRCFGKCCSCWFKYLGFLVSRFCFLLGIV
jgi:hypothetical protein